MEAGNWGGGRERRAKAMVDDVLFNDEVLKAVGRIQGTGGGR